MTGRVLRTWTALELARAVALKRAGVPDVEAARQLGRTPASYRHVIRYRGVSRRPDPAPRRAKVRRLHARGLCPADIARRLGCERETVVNDHRRLGLAPHLTPRAVTARRVVGICVRRHGKSPGALRVERERVAAFAAGWPAGTEGEVRYLAAFHRLGRLSIDGVAAAVGVGRPMAELMVRRLFRAGHLARAVPQRSRWAPAMYDLAAAVRERRDRVVAYQSDDVPA